MYQREFAIEKRIENIDFLESYFKKPIYDNKLGSGLESVIVQVYERYYLRLNSCVEVTVVAKVYETSTNVDVIISCGTLLNFGAEDDSLDEIVKRFTDAGFEEVIE